MEDFVIAIEALSRIMKINRLYYFLERLEEERDKGRISQATFEGQTTEIYLILEELTADSPYNDLAEELNLT